MRTAQLEDLPFLEALELASFPPHRCSNRRSLRASLKSETQAVLIHDVIDETGQSQPAASCILHNYKNSLRIYSIAVNPKYQGQGVGTEVLNSIIDYANRLGYLRISLEADAANEKLIQWYQGFGFEYVENLVDYYAAGEDAVRMRKLLPAGDPDHLDQKLNVIVVDQLKQWPFDIPSTQVVTAKDYLSSQVFQNSSQFRVFNLCQSFKPQRFGYYVSLLASARDQKVIPNVTSLRDISNISLVQSVADDLLEEMQQHLKEIPGKEFILDIYFGSSIQPKFAQLARLLAQQFELLLFRVRFIKEDRWEIHRVQLLNLSQVLKENSEQVRDFATKYFQKKRFRRQQFKTFQYDMGILVNPQEKTPPSSQEALHRLRDAAEKIGFYTEFITRQDYNRILEFDAIFIRETTSVDNHTYKFSRRAYAEGLIVMDDPWSILRCSNKMYLYERLSRGRVRQPRSWLICKDQLDDQALQKFRLPLVLKMPDGCFSTGVYKVSSQAEFRDRLNQLFRTTEVVIAQEFLQTPFDWRIGMLDGQPLYACKYYMVRGHWQIYNWEHQDAERNHEGEFETLPLHEVPDHVLQTATKGAALIGDGLYGVDLKEHQGKSYIIEINDNPNIDAGVEDQAIGSELYLKLMRSFLHRIERERSAPHFVSFRDD